MDSSLHPAQIEFLDHTADIGVRVRAATPTQAFVATAEAMFDFMVERGQVSAIHRWPVQVEANGWEDLLVTWLEELLYLYEMERIVPSAIQVMEITSTRLTAEMEGEYLDPARHETKIQIKAVTYHQLLAESSADGFIVQVLFDI